MTAADEATPAQETGTIAALNARPPPHWWVAGPNPFLDGKSIADYKRLLGATVAPAAAAAAAAAAATAAPAATSRRQGRRAAAAHAAAPLGQRFPGAFDARLQWPRCSWAIRNQGDCGSCWAFGAVEALQNRMCVGTAGAVDVELSAQDMTECAGGCMGCDGCDGLVSPWEHLEGSGVVAEACYPYKYCADPQSATCINSTAAAAAGRLLPPARGQPGAPTPGGKPPKTCAFEAGGACADSNSTPTFSPFRSLPGAASSLAGEALIQAAIVRNGPVECTFQVGVGSKKPARGRGRASAPHAPNGLRPARGPTRRPPVDREPR